MLSIKKDILSSFTGTSNVKESFKLLPSKSTVKRLVGTEKNVIVTKLRLNGIAELIPHYDYPRDLFEWLLLRSKKRLLPEASSSIIYAADLFSGCGGISLGIREACTAIGKDFKSLLAVDNDEHSLRVFIDNFNPRQAFTNDIRSLLTGNFGDSIQPEERELLKGIKHVDILLAGPPCQGHSNLNNHTRRLDDRNKLYEKVARFAEIAAPSHILIENVPTVVNSKDGSYLRTLEWLQKLGYHCDYGVVNLAELGVPQKRKRHLLVASQKKDIQEGTYISQIIKKHVTATAIRTLRWAIEDLETVENNLFNSSAQLNEENQRRIRYLFKNNLFNLPNAERPFCHQNEHHSYYAMYGRLDYDTPAQTLTTGFGSPGQGRYIHPSQPRTLTPHEAARIQFFPDFFDFSSVQHRKHLAKMLGNAVPMKLSYIFGLELLS